MYFTIKTPALKEMIIPIKLGKYKSTNPSKEPSKDKIIRTNELGQHEYNMLNNIQSIRDIVRLGDVYHIFVCNKHGRFLITGTIDTLTVYESVGESPEYIPSLNTIADFGISVGDGQIYQTSHTMGEEVNPVRNNDILIHSNCEQWEVLLVCPDGALVVYGQPDYNHPPKTRLITFRDKNLIESFSNLGVSA